jgi:hypothetical protein
LIDVFFSEKVPLMGNPGDTAGSTSAIATDFPENVKVWLPPGSVPPSTETGPRAILTTPFFPFDDEEIFTEALPGVVAVEVPGDCNWRLQVPT